jgi:hypothetical protein
MRFSPLQIHGAYRIELEPQVDERGLGRNPYRSATLKL